MNIKDKTKHERKIFAHFSEDDIKSMLTSWACSETGVNVDDNTDINIRFRRKDRCGTSGYEDYVELTITNNLLEEK